MIFNQIANLINWYEFDKCVKKYNGDYKVISFKCRQHFLTLLFATLCNKISLRDIEISLNSRSDKLYHMGFGKCKNVSRNNLSNANDTRNYRIYEEYTKYLISETRKLYKKDKILDNLNFDNNVYALDSTIIRTALNLLPWASYINKKNIAGVKCHITVDLRGNIPTVCNITNGRVFDGNEIERLLKKENNIICEGDLIIMDRGYCDYDKLYMLEKSKVYFICRVRELNIRYKNNQYYKVLKSIQKKLTKKQIDKQINYYKKQNKEKECNNVNNSNNSNNNKQNSFIISDELIILINKRGINKDYPSQIRLVECYNFETDEQILLFTNNLELDATIIAELYRKRWQIELFFKWIKQHLHIKKFYSFSENGVKVQIWITLCTYILIAKIKKMLNLKYSLYTIIKVLESNIFEKIDIRKLFQNLEKNNQIDNYNNNLFDFIV